MFYVYELRDEAGIAFYVGKGSNRRMYQHKYKAKAGELTPRADCIREILARGGSILPVVVFRSEDERAAYAEECRLIALYGRNCLTNCTDGGCGVRNLSEQARRCLADSRRGKKASEITRQRQREAKLGTPRSEATKAKIAAYQRGSKHPWARLPRSEAHRRKLATWKGRRHTSESKTKISASKMGHPVSKETRAKISAAKKGTTPWNKSKRIAQERPRMTRPTTN